MLLTKNNLQEFDMWKEEAATKGAALLIDKEQDWTSFNVVTKVRNTSKIKKVGHAGTLDPLATGLLILCLGKFTKKIEEFQGLGKTYIAEIKLGVTTKTDDCESEEENHQDSSNITLNKVESVIKNYIGEIDQIPPKYSAKKINGVRSYKLARNDEEFEHKIHKVKIDKIEILKFDNPTLTIIVDCSKGTYIRSLARDIGESLGCGAYLTGLRRTMIGDFKSDDALLISDFVQLFQKNN